MESPFPGMDPYLEHPLRWQSIHTQLVAGLPSILEPLLPERYAISVEERVYLTVPGDILRLKRPDAMVIDTESRPLASAVAGVATLPQGVEVLVPDEEPVRERYLTVRDLAESDEVVTVVEVLSPTNKLPGPGRDEYMLKRGAVLSSLTNLVEIDLLRTGPRMPAAGGPEAYDYGFLVRRGAMQPTAHLIHFSIREPIPRFTIPLRPGDVEPPIDLAAVLGGIYRSNRLGLRIDYRQPPVPPLSTADEAWAEALLVDAGLR